MTGRLYVTLNLLYSLSLKCGAVNLIFSADNLTRRMIGRPTRTMAGVEENRYTSLLSKYSIITTMLNSLGFGRDASNSLRILTVEEDSQVSFVVQDDCWAFIELPSIAASLTVAAYTLIDITSPPKTKEVSYTRVSNMIMGYMLSSLGRGLLHGDAATTGEKPVTTWRVKLNDFVAMQSAYLKVYTDSVGREYSRQLDQV